MESGRISSCGDHSHQQPHDQFKPSEVCWCKGASNLMEVKAVQESLAAVLKSSIIGELKSSMEELKSSIIQELKSSIPEEVEKVLTRVLPLMQDPVLSPNSSSLPHQAESSASGSYRLQFKGKLPDSLHTMTNIEDEGASLAVELCDVFGKRVETEPEFCPEVRFFVLDGGFKVEEKDDWTKEDFQKYIAKPREDKASSLLKGTCQVSLNGGSASVCGISFTDNSTRHGKFRLGAEVVKGCSPGVVIRPAVSSAFKVKERRLLTDRKHPNPSLTDDLWRLVNISKTGRVYGRAKEKKICKVKDFLQLFHSNKRKLREILQLPAKKWQETVKNAEACKLIQGYYEYCDAASGDMIQLNCIFKIESVTLKGQPSQLYESLDDSEKEKVGMLTEAAYENRDNLEFITGQLPGHVKPAYPTSAQQLEPEWQPAAPQSSMDIQVCSSNAAFLSSDQICGHPHTDMQYLDSLAANQGCIQQENIQFTTTASLDNRTYYEGNDTSRVYENQIPQVADYRTYSQMLLPTESTVGTAANQVEIEMQQMSKCFSANTSFNLDDYWDLTGILNTGALQRLHRAVNRVIIIRRFVPDCRPQKRKRT